MMKWTFNIISSHFSEFSKADWIDWFGRKLVPLLPSLTREMLSITLAEVDCGTYHVIIEGLNMAFEKMTLATKQQITLVLVEYLKRSHEVDNSGSLPCRSDTKSANSWLWVSFGRYSIYVTLQDLQLLNHEFSKFTSLEAFTVSQVCDLTIQSGALQNVDLINVVFTRLEEGSVFMNLEEFLEALGPNSQTLEISPEVRDIMMKWTFNIISSHFSEFSKADWIDWFGRKLVPLLPSLTREMLSITLAEVDCGTYHVIIEGLNMAFEKMTLATKQQITLVLVEYLKRSHEVDDSGSLPCRSDTKSANSWLWVSFGRYSIYVTVQDLQLLNHEFSKFTSLEAFTVSQVCDLTIQSGALQNVDLINVVFTRLEEGSVFMNLEEFLEALGPNSQTLEISPEVRDIMMKWTFNIISSHFSEFSKADWIDWFGKKLVPLLPSLTREMLSITLAEVDCGTYHVIIEGLNMAFEKMTLGTKQQITLVLVEYLKRSHEVDDSGLPCRSDTKSANSWLWVSFGRYSIYVTVQDLQLLNHEFSKFTSLEAFTVSQVCDLTIPYGALQNLDLINVVFNRLEEGSVFKNLEEFLEALGPNSQTFEISPEVRDIMMKWTFNIISSHFSEFSKADWIDWFGRKLVPLLPSLTTEMLSITLAEVDCGTYHVIIEGLNMAFEKMTLATKQQITLVLVEYLKRSHEVDNSGSLPCRSDTKSASSWLWLSFGRYSIYVTVQDLQLLNHEFSKFTSLEVFTVSQVCDLTIQSGALQNVDLINVVFNRLEEGSVFKNLEEFLEAFGPNSQTLEISPEVRDIMMKWTFNIISSHFSEFSKADWIDWFGRKLVPLLPSLTTEMLSITLAEVDCGTYHVIIEGLNMVFEKMTLATKQQITLVLVEYLKRSHEVDDSGSTFSPWMNFSSDTKSASSWIWISFGRYSIYVTLQDLQLLNHEFSKFTSLEVFTVSQVFELTIQSGALQNLDLINVMFNRLEEGSVFKNLEEFLEALGPISQTFEISPEVRDIMMKWTFNIISSHFSEFSKADWIDWFGRKLVPLLPSLTTEMLSITLAEVDCGTYHVIIEGLNMAFEKMTLATKQQITLVLVEYLKRSHEVDNSGLPCRSDTKSASSWLWLSFGRYSIYVTLQDLQLLNHEFSKFTSLEVFTVSQVCDLTIQSGALQNVDLINVVFNRLEEGSVFKNLEEFLEAFGPNSQTLEISPEVRDIMMKWTFNIISSHFSEFSKADWIDWFGRKLVPLLPSLTTEMLSITLAEVDCDIYHIM
ncbi:hypothetical protein NFI96_020095 [Prochilodus magdalenae]|nr:hypothetical protein NFI96_020095 [Prochilodus magdalenae]